MIYMEELYILAVKSELGSQFLEIFCAFYSTNELWFKYFKERKTEKKRLKVVFDNPPNQWKIVDFCVLG